MKTKIEIKKELTQSEVENIITQLHTKHKNIDNISEFVNALAILVKELTPSKEVYIFIEKEGMYETLNVNKKLIIDVQTSIGMLSKCCQTKEPLFINDVKRDKNYNAKIDNFFDYPLKNLLLIPLLDKDKEMIGIIWSGIPEGDWNQYIQSDINHMMSVTKEFEPLFIQHIDTYKSSGLVKKIQSWFSSSKKVRGN